MGKRTMEPFLKMTQRPNHPICRHQLTAHIVQTADVIQNHLHTVQKGEEIKSS